MTPGEDSGTKKAARPRGRVSRATSGADAGPLRVEKVRSAYQQVAEQLKHLILSGQLEPGARLPVESELVAMFGVSRSTVREALRVLSSQNLIVTARGVGGGSFVAHPEPNFVSDFLEASFGLLSGSEGISVTDLLEVRTSLEVPAARLAATRRTEVQLESMRSCLHEPCQENSHTFAGNAQFHGEILEASGNALLSLVARPVFTVLRTHFLRDRAPSSFWTEVTDDHQEIFEFIASGDAQGAGDAMEAHLGRLAPTYKRIVRQE